MLGTPLGSIVSRVVNVSRTYCAGSLESTLKDSVLRRSHSNFSKLRFVFEEIDEPVGNAERTDCTICMVYTLQHHQARFCEVMVFSTTTAVICAAIEMLWLLYLLSTLACLITGSYPRLFLVVHT